MEEEGGLSGAVKAPFVPLGGGGRSRARHRHMTGRAARGTLRGLRGLRGLSQPPPAQGSGTNNAAFVSGCSHINPFQRMGKEVPGRGWGAVNTENKQYRQPLTSREGEGPGEQSPGSRARGAEPPEQSPRSRAPRAEPREKSPPSRAPGPTPKTTRLHEISFTNALFIHNTQFIQVRKSDLKHVPANISLPVCTGLRSAPGAGLARAGAAPTFGNGYIELKSHSSSIG